MNEETSKVVFLLVSDVWFLYFCKVWVFVISAISVANEKTAKSAVCGNLIDLCTGPHIPGADRVKGFKVTKNSSAYWLGKKDNDDLQRVYAISFPKQSQLD